MNHKVNHFFFVTKDLFFPHQRLLQKMSLSFRSIQHTACNILRTFRDDVQRQHTSAKRAYYSLKDVKVLPK